MSKRTAKMRLVSIYNCRSGMILGKAVYHENGKMLISNGMELTDRFINRLNEQGVTHLYILDPLTDDIVIDETIPFELRTRTIQMIQTLFKNIHEVKGKRKLSDLIRISDFQKSIQNIISLLQSNKRVVDLLTHIHVKDNYLFSHSFNVMIYTSALAVEKGLPSEKIYEIAVGCLLHDIGKLLLPEEILHKPGRLTNEEFAQIKEHTNIGFELLRKEWDIPLLAAHCAFQHHEKWDGTGYPRGLKGEEIHPYARIMAVGDVFDALTTHRVYRRAMLPHEAMELIFSETNLHFEQGIVELFRKKIAIYPIGVTVKLSTGETGVVVAYNQHCIDRPIIRIFKGESGEDLKSLKEIDLSKELSVMIVECDAIL
ncbi:HD-GYP domain-containing protein [Ammoniphilus resinae]|uniref:Nucleotidyltransferase with HDIG domain n=1 Tax=Ammoniphilus resinae TaxID=861532 RepID=A0ABS4GW38_9BACL|nr:HD-GYP domain-containing protein [Ammoniphilus resinae]MBP1934075.1 putative nucleotidyltransferase with HDIG domain [Ammoniphilus resinae]